MEPPFRIENAFRYKTWRRFWYQLLCFMELFHASSYLFSNIHSRILRI